VGGRGSRFFAGNKKGDSLALLLPPKNVPVRFITHGGARERSFALKERKREKEKKKKKKKKKKKRRKKAGKIARRSVSR